MSFTMNGHEEDNFSVKLKYSPLSNFVMRGQFLIISISIFLHQKREKCIFSPVTKTTDYKCFFSVTSTPQLSHRHNSLMKTFSSLLFFSVIESNLLAHTHSTFSLAKLRMN